MNICADCSNPATIGSRCFRHYVWDLANSRGLFQYKWFQARFDTLAATLQGRYMVIAHGGTPPCEVEKLPRLLWRSDPRPFWVHHPKWNHPATVPWGRDHTRDKVMSLITTVETRARKEAERAANSSSKADRS